jgi:putative aldouronate transport system permease protein
VQKGGLSAWTRIKRQLARDWQLYLFVLPGVIYYVIFHYLPLYGIQIAFKDYKAVQGIAGSAWVGLKHFKAFFSSYLCGTLILNTLLVNMYNLLFVSRFRSCCRCCSTA